MKKYQKLVFLLILAFLLVAPLRIFGQALFEETMDDYDTPVQSVISNWSRWDNNNNYYPNYYWYLWQGSDDCPSSPWCIKEGGTGNADIRYNVSEGNNLVAGSLIWDFKPLSFGNLAGSKVYAIGDFRDNWSPAGTNYCARFEWDNKGTVLWLDVNNDFRATTTFPFVVDEVITMGFEWYMLYTNTVRFIVGDYVSEWYECDNYATSSIWSFASKVLSGGSVDYNAYWDNFRGYTETDDPLLFTEWPFATSSHIDSVDILYREYTGTPSIFKWGFEVEGYNPEEYDFLMLDIWNATSSVATTSFVLGTHTPFFGKRMDLVGYEEGVYHLLFSFYNSSTGATTTEVSFAINLSTEFPQYSLENFLIAQGLLDEEKFTDFLGLGALFKSWYDRLISKFPISWFFQVVDIWTTKVEALGTKEAVEPLQVAWTTGDLPGTSFDNKTFMLFDLSGADEEYGTYINIFRTILIYVIWLSALFLIIGKVRGFFARLGD